MRWKSHKDRSEVRVGTLSVRVNIRERRTLQALAELLQRTQSDTVRLLIRQAARGLQQCEREAERMNVVPETDAELASQKNKEGKV